ncbi:MAG: bis(5'-nucleosyl)-tetraphosphatase (symmetrical) YqeK [Oscillospiraceae bacterium]|jgi:nicotinate-nucleotide adenylyltransferase|nr:bis(5'-nucleosyl)-tetraphosphatase (symmetrical) YqeK [Oscillospiraceae bacterium]
MQRLTAAENEMIEIYKKDIKKLMSESRYQHSLAVADQSNKLAAIYGCGVYKASVAGLLHDVAKELDPQMQLELIREYKIPFEDGEMVSQSLWHTGAGAAYIQKHFGIIDKEIINAVLYHTSGRGGMDLLEMIIFVADKISADRTHVMVASEREVAETSLQSVILRSLQNTIPRLIESNVHISPKTIETYNYYRNSSKAGIEAVDCR